MGELSVFVDESGDFGSYSVHSPFYFISLVFHNQSIDISSNVKKLDDDLESLGYSGHCIHTGPLVRREKEYACMDTGMRKQLLNQFYFFLKHLDYKYLTIEYNKLGYTNELDMISQLSKSLSTELLKNANFFSDYKKIIIYYDRGQAQITRILSSVFSSNFPNKEIVFKENVTPNNYKLFQASDVICTFELINKKISIGLMSKSEKRLFNSDKEFKKNYYKSIKSKKINK